MFGLSDKQKIENLQKENASLRIRIAEYETRLAELTTENITLKESNKRLNESFNEWEAADDA